MYIRTNVHTYKCTYVQKYIHTYIQTNVPPKTKKREFALFFFRARRFRFFSRFFFFALPRFLFSFALASAKARKHEKSVGAQLCRRIDKWPIFGWYWSNIEHYSLFFQQQPIWFPSQRSKWKTNSLLGFHHQNCLVPRQNVNFQFFARRCCWSHPGHRFSAKIQNHCCSRNQLDLELHLHAQQRFCPANLFCLL